MEISSRRLEIRKKLQSPEMPKISIDPLKWSKEKGFCKLRFVFLPRVAAVAEASPYAPDFSSVVS